MARQSKKLKLSIEIKLENKTGNRIHLDRVDTTLAEEHYGNYLIGKLTKAQKKLSYSSRIYLSMKHKKEFYKLKAANGNNAYKKQLRESEHFIFDICFDNRAFTESTIKEIFKSQKTQASTVNILRGLSTILKYLHKNSVSLNSLFDIKTSDQEVYYQFLVDEGIFTKTERRCLSYIFSEFENINEDFEKIKSLKNQVTRSSTLKALPSTIVYQLENYVKQELEEITQNVYEYNQWIEELESKNIFAIENIAKTFLDELNESGVKKSRYKSMLIIKMKKEYQIDMDILMNKKSKIVKASEEKNHYNSTLKYIHKLSESGTNINIKNEKMHILWHKELFSKWPYRKNLSKGYEYLTNDISDFRKWMRKFFETEVNTVEKRIYPAMNEMYPFVLFLMIRHGMNLEVLSDWKVEKTIENSYKVIGDEVEMFTTISGIKNRSNDEITSVIKNDSLEKKYLNFYIEWATPIYEDSNNNSLFQYGNFIDGKNRHQELSSAFFTNVKNSSSSFFNKYEILDSNGKRLKSIDHRRLRKSHNYQDFLRGKSKFERQVKKNHKSEDTTNNHYENNAEWEGLKMHKIATAQNLVIGIFKGEITSEEHKTAKLINGPMADCKNNKLPTFDNAKDLKDEEFCSDWSKCLTECDKACVIPMIHGPVIYAWISYMELERESFVRDSDWEKEYLIDYDAAIDTTKYFSEKEIAYSKQNSHKHANFVRMKFTRIIKIKGDRHG